MDKPDSLKCHWVEDGRLLAGEHPGPYDQLMAREDLNAPLGYGIRTFVDLTEPEEAIEPYEEALEEEAAASGSTARPLPDRTRVGRPEGAGPP